MFSEATVYLQHQGICWIKDPFQHGVA